MSSIRPNVGAADEFQFDTTSDGPTAVAAIASKAKICACPPPAFFHRLISEACVSGGSIVYVGDRLDNDVLPAHAAGMRTLFVLRGPWGYLRALKDEPALGDLRTDSSQEISLC